MNLQELKYSILRFLIREYLNSSDGINIAFKEGLTSGVMLDYIYRNRPSGMFIIGEFIDRIFLSHPAWRSIRARKETLQRLLRKAITAQRQFGRKPVVLDVASGAARYLLDVLREDGMGDVEAGCRERDARSLEFGRRVAAKRGLSSVCFVCGDALCADSLARVRPTPNIIIASGFYDWIPEEEVVRKSMRLIYDLLPGGGFFLFTNLLKQTHLEMAQAVFPGLNGKPLQLFPRPAEMINSWVEAAGFTLLETSNESTGCYSFTLAQKPPRP